MPEPKGMSLVAELLGRTRSLGASGAAPAVDGRPNSSMTDSVAVETRAEGDGNTKRFMNPFMG